MPIKQTKLQNCENTILKNSTLLTYTGSMRVRKPHEGTARYIRSVRFLFVILEYNLV